jgi:hypothetical protein
MPLFVLLGFVDACEKLSYLYGLIKTILLKR